MKFIPGVLLALLIVAPVFAATWRYATVSGTPEGVIRDLITAEHEARCAGSITADSQLIWAARYKAQDMAYRDRLSHAFVDGARMWDFYDRVGIPHSGGSAEILAWNTYPIDVSPTVAFNGWMGSSGHRAVIVSCTYTRFGVGAFLSKDKNGKWYAAEFTRP
jgi:uncharacterized protein YkwD